MVPREASDLGVIVAQTEVTNVYRGRKSSAEVLFRELSN